MGMTEAEGACCEVDLGRDLEHCEERLTVEADQPFGVGHIGAQGLRCARAVAAEGRLTIKENIAAASGIEGALQALARFVVDGRADAKGPVTFKHAGDLAAVTHWLATSIDKQFLTIGPSEQNRSVSDHDAFGRRGEASEDAADLWGEDRVIQLARADLIRDDQAVGCGIEPAVDQMHPLHPVMLADCEGAEEVEALHEIVRQRETLSVNLDRLDGLLIGEV